MYEWDAAKADANLAKHGIRFERVHVLIYTPRGEAIRVISLRRAGKREVQAYNEAQT